MIKDFIKNAFCYISDDNRFLHKAKWIFPLFLCLFLIGKCMSNIQMPCYQCCQACRVNPVIPVWGFVYLAAVSCIFYLILGGYKILCVKELLNQNNLPEMDLSKAVKSGFRYFIALCLIMIPFYYFMCGSGFLVGYSLVVAHISTSVYYNVIMNLAIFVAYAILIISLLLYFVYWYALKLGLTSMYAESDSWFAFYRIKELFSNIKGNVKKYIVTLVMDFALLIFTGYFCRLIKILSAPDCYIVSVIAAIVAAYTYFVNIYLTAKVFRE